MAEYTLKAKLTADAREFVTGISKAKDEMGGLQKFSVKVGDKLSGFGKTIGKVGDSLTSKITKPALIAGTAIASITIGKGLQRLIGIDTARAKLVGLGHDAKSVETIMGSALDSVRGTSYGLEEAATTAANAVAAGIEPGKELTRYLSLTGDAAAIAGSEMGEMGSILNKVSTSNKAYNGELQQLSDKGLPIYSWLAKEAKVADDAIFDMASNGEISSKMLMNAIENNIGGAAKKMGEESFVAGLANMWAAVGRLGASFLDAGGEGGGFFSTLKPMIADFTGRIDSMGDIAEKAGVKFGEMFTSFIERVKEVKGWYDDLSPTIQNIINKTMLWGTIGLVAIGPILKILSPIIQLFGFLASSVIPKVIAGFQMLGPVLAFLISPVGLIVGAIALLTAGFVHLYNTSETFRDTINSVFETIKNVVMEAIGIVSEFIMEIWGGVVEWWSENNTAMMQVAESTWSFITGAIEIASNVIVSIFNFFAPFIKLLIIDTFTAIKNTIQGAVTVVLNIISLFANLFTGNWSGLWDSVKNILSGAVQLLWGLVNLWFVGKILKVGKTFFNLFKGVFTSGWNFIKGIFTRTLSSITSNVSSKFNTIKNTATRIFGAVKDAMTKPVTKARDLISNAIDKIKGFFSGLKLKFPKITMPKMPKFSLTGKFSLIPPSVPKVGIKWNAQGGVMNKPTIFGSMGNTLMGGGEAGPEAILPLNSKVLGGIGKGIASTMNRGNSRDEAPGDKQPINIYIRNEGDLEYIRSHVNHSNAVDQEVNIIGGF